MKTNLSKNFRTVLQKDASNDYFFFELPFNPYIEFEIKDESLFVNLLINESKFYSQIIKLEDNKFIRVERAKYGEAVRFCKYTLLK